MHAPDGLLTVETAIVTAGLSVATVSLALRQTGQHLATDRIPLAGVTAAFLFASQMINFPIGGGTSGHIIGAALAAIILGPHLGTLSSAVVVVTQALMFADGGITALGYNVINLAIVPAYGGYAMFVLARRMVPQTQAGYSVAGGLAAGASVVASAIAFSVQWLFGASAPVPFDTVFSAMVGVHTLIGIGEGVVTGFALAAILKARPDIVVGVDQQSLATANPTSALGGAATIRVTVAAVFLVAVAIAAVVSQFASAAPDGLERVTDTTGMAPDETSKAAPLFADYAMAGVDDPTLSLAVAGVAGVVIVAVTVAGVLLGAQAVRPSPLS